MKQRLLHIFHLSIWHINQNLIKLIALFKLSEVESNGDHCCCGQCGENFSCVQPDSTTGAGHWQSTLCPAEGCGSEGEVTSPNHPDNYPNNLEKTHTIQVEQGLILLLQFNAFDIEEPWYDYDYDTYEYDYESDPTCHHDHLTITDGDGTTLMEKSCGSTLPPAIRSRTNTINLVFTTDGNFAYSGWSVSWRAVAGWTDYRLEQQIMNSWGQKNLVWFWF